MPCNHPSYSTTYHPSDKQNNKKKKRNVLHIFFLSVNNSDIVCRFNFQIVVRNLFIDQTIKWNDPIQSKMPYKWWIEGVHHMFSMSVEGCWIWPLALILSNIDKFYEWNGAQS